MSLLFHINSSEEEMNVNLDMFWTEYIQFDNKVGSYDADAHETHDHETYLTRMRG